MGVTRQMATDDIRVNLELRGEQRMARGLKNVGDAAEDAGDNLRDMGEDANFVGKQSALAAESVKRLVAQLNKTGDTSLLKDIGKERRKLRQFQNLAKELIPDDVSIGIGRQLWSGIASGATALGPAKVAIAGLAAATAPLIGGAVAGAVLGGVGAGGIAGGIALAAQDPAVQSAAQDLAASVSQAWTANGETFVEPVVDALDRLSTTGVDAAAKLRPGMDALAKTIEPLAEGIDGLVDNTLPGLNQALKASAPVVRFLSNELPELGDSFSDFLGKVSRDPDGAILALGTLINAAEDAIEGAGNLVFGLSSLYEGLARTAEPIAGFLSDIYGWLPLVGDSITSGHEDLQGMLDDLDKAKTSTDDLGSSTSRLTLHTYELGVAADGAADALTAQREAMSKLVDLELAAVSGTIAYERAIDNLADARNENGKTLDLDTEKGRANTEMILTAIEAVKENAEREYDLAIAHSATAQEAERAAAAYRDKFGKELAARITQLYGNTAAVQALLGELEKLNGQVIRYTVVQQGGRTVGFKAPGGIQLKDDAGVYRRAAGGGVRPGPIYRVGENGPELLQFGAHGTITNAVQSRAAMSGASGGMSMVSAGGGSAQATLSVAPTGHAVIDAFLAALADHFRLQVRTTANGDPTEYWT